MNKSLKKERKKAGRKIGEKFISKKTAEKSDINQQNSNTQTHIFHFIVLINGGKFFLKFPVLDLFSEKFMWIIRVRALNMEQEKKGKSGPC